MTSEILINTTGSERRVVLLENNAVVEFYLERQRTKSIVGNVYKAKVIRVLPGIQAAFVDIGLEKAGFLYVSDFYDIFEELEDQEQIDEFSEKEADPSQEDSVLTPFREAESSDELGKEYQKLNIQDLLQEGQEILVQVTKEPLGTKGARLTSRITLPGKYLVFMPTVNHVGVSRRIADEFERKRLKDLIHNLKPVTGGFIARTASEGISEDELQKDMLFLLNLWKVMFKDKDLKPVPSLVFEDLNLEYRTIRDMVTPEIERIVIDNKKSYENILNFIDNTLPHVRIPVFVYYDGVEPLFEARGVEEAIKEALKRKVRLKSGGYIVIDQAEALTAIDVNTGGFVGKNNLEDTVLRTNIEAIKEIVFQLRLRNIGGIIIIDFIDMEKESNRDRVFQVFRDALRSDRAKTTILKISELGLIEMTRKRTRESLLNVLSIACSYCKGNGYVKAPDIVLYEILRALRKEAFKSYKSRIVLTLNDAVARILHQEEEAFIEDLEKQCNVKIIAKSLPNLHINEFEIVSI